MQRTETHLAFANAIREYRLEVGDDIFLHQAKQVRELLDHPGTPVLAALLERREGKLIQGLLPGTSTDNLPTFEAHVRALALASGLRQARQVAQTFVVKAEEREKEIESSAGAGE